MNVNFKDFYHLNPTKIGMALIINIIKYEKRANRRGAEKDSQYMKLLWEQLGYTVIVHDTGKFTTTRINDILTDFIQGFENLEGHMSCVIFVGAHGEDGKFITSDDKSISVYEEFVPKFVTENCFHGKPKIFFIQSCQTFSPHTTYVPGTAEFQDTIVCYPAIPGETADRDVHIGTWYVRTLAEVFMTKAHCTELLDMLKEVNKLKCLILFCKSGQPPWAFYL